MHLEARRATQEEQFLFLPVALGPREEHVAVVGRPLRVAQLKVSLGAVEPHVVVVGFVAQQVGKRADGPAQVAPRHGYAPQVVAYDAVAHGLGPQFESTLEVSLRQVERVAVELVEGARQTVVISQRVDGQFARRFMFNLVVVERFGAHAAPPLQVDNGLGAPRSRRREQQEEQEWKNTFHGHILYIRRARRRIPVANIAKGERGDKEKPCFSLPRPSRVLCWWSERRGGRVESECRGAGKASSRGEALGGAAGKLPLLRSLFARVGRCHVDRVVGSPWGPHLYALLFRGRAALTRGYRIVRPLWGRHLRGAAANWVFRVGETR